MPAPGGIGSVGVGYKLCCITKIPFTGTDHHVVVLSRFMPVQAILYRIPHPRAMTIYSLYIYDR